MSSPLPSATILLLDKVRIESTTVQGCWRIERSLNRGLDRCRGLGLGGPFFSDSCSKLEIDVVFRISHKLGLDLAAKFSKVFAIQLDRFRGQYTPHPSAHPPKILDLCVSQGSLDSWPHICSTSGELERSSHPLSPSAPPSSPPSSPPLPPPHFPPPPHLFDISHILRVRDYFPETVFLNVCGAQELLRNEFRQPTLSKIFEN